MKLNKDSAFKLPPILLSRSPPDLNGTGIKNIPRNVDMV
jgi:hypothetical protein